MMLWRAAYTDLRARSRGGATFVAIVVVVAIFGLAVALAFHALGQQPAPVVSFGAQNFGRSGTISNGPATPTAVDALTASSRSAILLVVLGGLMSVCGAVVAATVGAASVAGEHERETIDLLLTTQLGAGGVTAVKTLSTFMYSLLVVLAAAPAFGLLLVFSSLPLESIGAALLIVLGSILLSSAIGVFFSSLTRSSAAAFLSAVGTVTFLLVGAAALYLLLSRLSSSLHVLTQLLLLPSPVAALVSSNYGQFQAPDAVLLPALLRASPAHPVHLAGAWQLPVPLWLLTITLDVVGALLLSVLTNKIIQGTGGARRLQI